MRQVICFYKPEEPNGYLSNWYPSSFTLDGVGYTSMEQYMMYQKAALFEDADAMAQILAADSPGKIKALGRGVRGYDDQIWSGLRQVVVYEGLLEKFRQHEDLRERLLSTGGALLAECTARDRIWGIGLSMKDPRRSQPGQWQGTNLLGFSLMQVRRRLA